MNIFHILGKDLRQMGIVTTGLLLLIITLAILSSYLSVAIVTTLAVTLSGAYVVTALLAVERYEDRNNGYMYLLRLPVHPAELAAGKLVLIYVMNILACGLVIALVRLLGADSRTIRISESIVLMAGCVWLLAILTIYTGICILGYTRFVVVFRIVIMSLLVAVQALGVVAFKIGKDLPHRLSLIGDGIAELPWFVICLLVSAIYVAYVAASAPLVRRHAMR